MSAKNDKSLVPFDARCRVVEDIGAPQRERATRTASPTETGEGDSAVQELQSQAFARLDCGCVGTFPGRETVLPEPDDAGSDDEEYEGSPAQEHCRLGAGGEGGASRMIRLPMNTSPGSLPPDSLRPRWDVIDTVLLDMDGTLLDLQFDNFFWLQLVPERFALRHSLTLDAAREVLRPRFAACYGTLDWYCTDFWSRELELDIAELKREIREQVRYLPGAEEFLATMQRRGLRTALLTNAHRDSLTIKAQQTDLIRYFDVVVSSHEYGVPKESREFWLRAQAQIGFDPARSLFVDDSLPVLRAAHDFGIAQVYAIARPDSQAEPRQVTEFPAIDGIIDLLDT